MDKDGFSKLLIKTRYMTIIKKLLIIDTKIIQ